MKRQREPLAVQSARARKAEQAAAWDNHLKFCRTCRPLTDSRNRYCDDGWEIAKVIASAEGVIRDYERGQVPGQLMLL